MLTATLEPLIKECQQAIEFAQGGDHSAARGKLDRVRYLRSVISRSRVDAGPNDATPKLSAFDTPDLLAAQTVAAEHVNRLLEILREWISSSRSAFTMEELRLSSEGMELFIDEALPEIWDFNEDIVALTDQDGLEVLGLLSNRGQRRFIWLTDADSAEQHEAAWKKARGAMVDEGQTSVEDNSLLFLTRDQQLDVGQLKDFVGAGLPRVALIAYDPSVEIEERFNALSLALASAVIKATTAKQITSQVIEQYITKMRVLSECPSIMELQHIFNDADVLVLSPGPSLRNDFELIKTSAAKFITIAPVKSLEALFNEGIKPDFSIWMDPRDHSYAIPDMEAVRDIPIILGECCHTSFFEAPFKRQFIYPDPATLLAPTNNVLHGDDPILCAGSNVSVLATVIAIGLGAKSVTLIGQDLSVGGGQYVSPSAIPGESSRPPPNTETLTCEAIGGGELPTLPNYLGFISEFKLVAAALGKTHELINCTSSGAFLDGWRHICFADHPLLIEEAPQMDSLVEKLDDIVVERGDDMLSALEALKDQFLLAAKLGEDLAGHCLLLIESGSSDFSDLEVLEERLKLLLHEECPMIANYLAHQSIAMNSALAASRNIEDNLRLSTDYYTCIASAAHRLSHLIDVARTDLRE